MAGLFDLNHIMIDAVLRYVSPGAYVLYRTLNGPVRYVGRSDTDLNRRLKEWVGVYRYFASEYASSPWAAFLRECALYHDLGGDRGMLENQVHPARPEGTNWRCPHCSLFR